MVDRQNLPPTPHKREKPQLNFQRKFCRAGNPLSCPSGSWL